MKKIVITSIIMSICINIYAYVPFGYHSIGIDTYADGNVINDGECYALVWTKDEFSGFDRSGNVIDSDDQIIYVRALAKDGRCPPVNFMIPDDFYATHKDGIYSVIVLDTRSVNKEFSYSVDSEQKLSRVNGWEYANVQKDISTDQIATVIAKSTTIPRDAKIPRIVSFNVNLDKSCHVDFDNAEQYLSYQLKYKASLDDTNTFESVDHVDGTNDINRLFLSRIETAHMTNLFINVKSIDIVGVQK